MQLPGEVKFNYFDGEGNMQELTVDELTKGKKVGGTCKHKCDAVFGLQLLLYMIPTTIARFKGKEKVTPLMQVVLFAVPGAFTPTCSSKHLPGFIEKAEEFKAKGVDTIACVSVNDAFVMQAWGKTAGIDGKILMLADGSADFAKVMKQ